ncbi:MAG: hypothetical protein KDC98_01450 [Planctomycetes bacterium]|nr:hypothetical protein [Planctomycetota bacterium]
MNVIPFCRRLLWTATLTTLAATATAVRSQQEPERIDRLRGEQQEILRKTERLQTLMTRLLQRYQREGKKEQVDLLEAGLAHLEQSAILHDVASIRDDLGATALSEALRKQTKVVADLEQLLNILLDRRSVESIAEAAKLAGERAATARQLEERQRQLQQRTEDALRSEPTEAERELLDRLAELANAEQREAERNARDSGTRRPFLEAALARVQQLLRDEERLTKAMAEESGGEDSTTRQRQFDLGELIQQTRDLAGHVRGQDRQADLQAAAEALIEAAESTDRQAREQARHRLDALVQDAPKVPGTSEGERADPEWKQFGEKLRQAPDGETPAERQALKALAQAGAELAQQRSGESAERNAKDSSSLANQARGLAEKLAAEHAAAQKPGEMPAEGESGESPRQSLEQAAAALDKAEADAKQGNASAAQREVDRALSALELARRQHRSQHPDAEQQAGSMAAEAGATARELENSPRAEAAERNAAEQLRSAGEQLRGLEEEVGKSRQEGRTPAPEMNSKGAREQLQEAKRTLEQALANASEGRQEEMQAAAARQAELAQQAEQTAAAMRDAVESGKLTSEQAKQASESMQQARQDMQQAEQSLRSGQQSSASQQQRQAAQALAEAARQMQQNQPMTEQQKQELGAEAAAQKQLAEDIIRLAEMLDEQQQAARRKLDEAAAAADRAQQAMERGDAEETREQQEEARQKLEEAARELEQERDRYQDMRQEELLFKMKEELLALLEQQRPITAETLQAQEVEKSGRLSRPLRVKLNRLGEQEHELAGRIDFLVTALADEGNLVYQTVLRTILEDLREIGDRLGGRSPDVGSFTTLMQQDVERRSEDLLTALENERKRREQQRKDQQQQQQQGENKLNQQQQRLVGQIAELEMLKTLLEDTGRATADLHLLVSAGSAESITATEGALVERLAHRHAEITKLFSAIKAAVEETMQQMDQDQGHGGGR